ncbi:MAG: hypothetical protein PHS62_03915 [Patescibacteria group bacterium]|nr:hypothetical protein [Patescibacteria group bacterium]
MSNSFIFYSVKILTELIGGIAYFPVWWYSRGLVNLLLGVKDFLVNKQKALALIVWVKNIFKPMYAQYDWQGILISFFVRAVQIVFRSIIMLFWAILGLAAVIFWLLLPILVIYEISFQLI